MHLPMRMLSLIVGIAGAVIGFVINVLNSSLHFVGRIVGVTTSSGHLFIGSLVAIVAVVASILVLFAPEVGAILLVICTIGFFFAIGWWALIPAVFLLFAAWAAFMSRTERQTAAR